MSSAPGAMSTLSWLGRTVRASRHPLRMIAMSLAALAVTAGVALSEGVVAAVLGALAGVLAGEWLGKSKWRLPVVLGACGGALMFALGASALALRWELVPSIVGPGLALRLAGLLRYGVGTLALVAGMRALVLRHKTALAIELVVVVATLTASLAAHRDGVLARPMWLSDWAWQVGFDPANVLLGIGGGAVVLLAVLLVAESEGEPSLASLIALPLLALLAVSTLDVADLPKPPSDAGDLGLINPPGEPPNPPRNDGGSRGPEGNGDGGGGGRPGGDGGTGGSGREGDGGTGGGTESGDGGSQQGSGGDAGLRDGGASGAGDGGVGVGGGDGGSSAAGGDGGLEGGAGGGGGSDGGRADGGAGVGGGDGGSSGGTPPPPWPDAGGTRPPPVFQDGGSGGTPPPQGGDGGAEQNQRPPPRQQRTDEDQMPSSGSPSPMAIVVLDDDYSAPSGAYYFRQSAWSEYNGSRFVESPRDDVDLDTIDDFPTTTVRVRDPVAPRGRTKVSGRVALLVEHEEPFALESAISFRPSSNPNPSRFVRAFRFTSMAQTVPYQQLLGRKTGDRRWSEEIRAYYLRGPEDPRYATLAREIVARLPPEKRADPFAQAVAIKLWMDHEMTYSTRERHAGVPDPTADFLFGNRIGYCVHFAHAAVYMWRSLGIPSRVSTGYHFDEQNRRGGSAIMLRGSDGHAWPEVYVQGYGWIVLDIAAEKNLDPPGTAPDDDLQRMLGEMAREETPDPAEPPPPKRREPTHFVRNTGIFLAVVLALALIGLFLAKLWRRFTPLWTSPRDVARVSYRAALDLLGEAGLTRDEGETREAFADRVAAISPAFRKLTDHAIAIKLRDPKAPASVRAEWDKKQVRETLRTTRSEVRRGTKLWRRALGFFNPVSFFLYTR